jgi:peptidoglycan/LPS O-acetylase OafA/YrhL
VAAADTIIVLAVLPLLVILAVNCEVPAWASGAARWRGALSYPLYAVHAPLLRGFETALNRLPDDQAKVGWALALPVVITLAALFEHFLDAPIRAWLAARQSRPAPVGPP